MGDNNTGLVDNAAKKAAESVGNRVGNAAVDTVKKVIGEAQVLSGHAFTRYLESAIKRYNRIKTIATGTQYRSIIGENELYVHIEVSYQGKRYSTRSIEKLLVIDSNLLIEGTGGAGKSMLMRYLFLDTAFDFLNRGGRYVPVLLELRRLGAQMLKDTSDEARVESLTKSVHSCIAEFDDLELSQIKSSLRAGKLLLLFDGFDEVPEALARDMAVAIQLFCTRYDSSPCVITSRPREHTAPLETFSVLQTLPLRKGQAIKLASRIWDEDEKTIEFRDQLDKELFDRHKDFASNPLLLTMMFLTFMHNGSIPDHRSEFYQRAYEALYSAHDNQNKGVYKREFKCKTLNEENFTRLFSWFCFQSYFYSKYEFSEERLLSYLEKGIEKLSLSGVKSRDYLKDLQNIVCMIVRDGTIYRFSHRSFQAYFAAYYTSKHLNDEEQKHLFFSLLTDIRWAEIRDYYELLFQLSPERFTVNALEDGLRKLQREADASPDPNLFFLKAQFRGIYIRNDSREKGVFSFLASHTIRAYNLPRLFIRFLMNKSRGRIHEEELGKQIIQYIEKAGVSVLYFDDFTQNLSLEEYQDLFQKIIAFLQIEQKRAAIRQWLDEQDEKRKAQEMSSNLSALLDAL